MIKFIPTDKQKEFLTNPATIRLFLAGFGTGKTTVNVIETFYQMVFEHPGYAGLVIAPTFKHIQQAFLMEWKKLIPQALWTMNVQQQTITLFNNSTIFLRYANDGLNLAGINAAFVSIDEAALMDDPEAFRAAMSRLRQGAPNKPLRAILTTTPNGYSYITDEFGIGPDNNKWFGTGSEWHSEDYNRATVRAKTTDNPHLPKSYIKSLLENSPEWVAQYVNAEYTKAEGLVFKEFSYSTHVIKSDIIPKKFRRIVCGIDWGYTNNGSAIVIAETMQGNYVVIEEHVHKNMLVDSNGWFKIFEDINKRYYINTWLADPAQPAYIESLRIHFKQRELVYAANNKRLSGTQTIKSLFHQKKLYVNESCSVLIGELTRLKYKENSEDSVKKNDHCVDALRYGVMGIIDFDLNQWSK